MREAEKTIQNRERVQVACPTSTLNNHKSNPKSTQHTGGEKAEGRAAYPTSTANGPKSNPKAHKSRGGVLGNVGGRRSGRFKSRDAGPKCIQLAP